MRRTLLTVAVVAMLVLAGCNGGPGGTTTPGTAETTTATDAQTAADTQPTTTGSGTAG